MDAATLLFLAIGLAVGGFVMYLAVRIAVIHAIEITDAERAKKRAGTDALQA